VNRASLGCFATSSGTFSRFLGENIGSIYCPDTSVRKLKYSLKCAVLDFARRSAVPIINLHFVSAGTVQISKRDKIKYNFPNSS
jgi:hypothetical protein